MSRYRTQFPDGTGMYLTKAMAASKMRHTEPPEGWRKHTPYHWSIDINGERLDFWPTKDKWMFRGKFGVGDVDAFISKMKEPQDAK